MAILGHSHKVVLATVLLFAIRSVYMQGAPPCDLPFFESSEVCVKTCPEFQFGNHLSGACEPLPNDYRVAINATQFRATAIVNASLGMPVIYFTTIINNTFFQDPDVVTISVVRSDETEDIFSLENGANSESITNPASGLPPSTAVITIDRAVIYSSAPPPTIELPATFDFDINVAVVKDIGGDTLNEDTQALGVVVVREVCEPNPCERNGTCIPQGLEFSCECILGFGGPVCETDLNFCQDVDCMNGGLCVEGVGAETQCLCAPGFSGSLCEIDINECGSAPCLNGGNCTDEVLSFSCTCVVGYSGETCETDLDFCQNDTCDNGGSCSEGPGSETSCDCMEGFTGATCETDLDFCQNDTCMNGGTCVEQYGPNTTCLCLEGVTGTACETDLDFCENETCMNGGSCVEELGVNTSCNCLDGYGGTLCEVDLDFCQNDTCLNGGSCMEGNGTETTCNCIDGFSGLECEVDLDNFCQNDTCMNGGNCTEGFGPEVSCTCPEGFDGSSCEVDLAFCETDTCTRNGNCFEGLGTETFCDCFPGYTGLSCEMDLDIFCMPNPCRNGGSCNEGPGDTFTCDCLPGYSGLDCSIDLDFCTPESCLNDGTCVETFGETTTCLCAPGFTGTICDSDDPDYVACNSGICLNGGSCMEEFGSATSCNCTPGFSGPVCENDLDVCQSALCENGGTCVEGVGDSFSCNCSLGYSGSACTEDDESILFCESNNMCQNGATCREEFGPNTSCRCAPGYNGVVCEEDLDFCTSTTCQNNGTCREGLGSITSCICSTGYTGATCEEDDQNFIACESNSCMNGGTCMEEFGPNTSCSCATGYSGAICEDLDFCTSTTCQNDGTCREGLGNIISCICSTGYTGATCEEDDQNFIACESNSCMNGGTCMEEFGPNILCLCPPDFNGTLCELIVQPTDTPSSRGIIGVPTYVFWIIVGVAGGVIVIALYLVICLICVVHYKRKQKMRTYTFEGGNTQQTSELSLMGFEQVVREGVQTTSNDEMNASTGSLASNLSDSGDDSVDAMDTVRPYATVHNPTNVTHPNRAAQNPTNETNTVHPYATLRNPDGDPVSTSETKTISPYATLQNPANINNQATATAAIQNPMYIPSSDHPSASTQNPDPPYATVKNSNKTDANQPFAQVPVRVTFTKPAERTGAPGETNPLQTITEPAGPLVPERTPQMFETASPPMTPEAPASPATPITARTGSNTSSPTSLPSPQHTSTPIQALARPDHSTVITNPIAVQSMGDASSTSDTGLGRPTWSLDPTSASTTLVGSEEDFTGYANKNALLAMAASTDLPLSGSDDSTVLANAAAVGDVDGPQPLVAAFGRERSPVSQQPTMISDLEQRSPVPQEAQSQIALQQAIQQQLEEHSQQQLQGLQESFERYTLRLEQQLTKQQKNWEEDMRRKKEEEDWARHEKKRVEMMMASQQQSLGSFPEFGRSTSPTSPILSESEDEVLLSGKIAASSAGIKNTEIQRQELLTPSNATKITIPPKSLPRDSSPMRGNIAQASPVLTLTPPTPTILPSPPLREHSVPVPPPLKETQPVPPLLPSPPLREDVVTAPPLLKAAPPTQPLPPPPPLTTPLPLKETLPAPPPSKATTAVPPPLKETTPVKRIPPPKPSRDGLIPAAPPLQDSAPPRPPPPPPPPPPPSTDNPMPDPPRSSAWPPAPVLPPPPRLNSLSPSASPQRPTIPAPVRQQKPMILPPPGIRYVTLERPDLKTSFGFVVLSNTKRKGCVISRLVPDSPAHSCGQLFIMDEVLAVNGQDVCSMDHAAILALIKNSGTTVQLTVQQPTIIIKKRPRGRRNLSSEFSGPLRRFESIQEVDEEEDEDDEMGGSDDEPLRFQRTWSLPIGNKEAEIRFPSSQYVHNSVSNHVDTSQEPSQQALLNAPPQQDQQAASGSSAQEVTSGIGQSGPVVEQYDDVHFIRHKPPKLLDVPASAQFDESKVKFGKSHVSPNQHKKNRKRDPLTAGADSELKAALRVRRKQLMQNGMEEDQ